jgi:tRNA A-37 threonylcarbamoyl transferase component Bud32
MDRPPDDPESDAAEPVKPRPVKPKAVPPPKPKVVPAKPVKPAQPAKPVKPAKPTQPATPTRSAGAAPRAKGRRRRRRGKRRVAAPQAPAPAPAPKAEAPAAAAEKQDALVGLQIARCTLEALVGVGKTARVYRAKYEAIDDTVAVKILRSDVAHHPQLVERFLSEARAIAQVDNENVPKIYDVGVEDGRHYMVVELLEGEEILDLIGREEQVELMDSLRIVRQAANGLRAAHADGLVHRDIKPQNLFLLEDGTVKVVDFGLAARFDEESERVGTPHYMAPEVCELGNAEFASDIYALGIVLYHLLVGQPPYAGQDIRSILQSHMEGVPLHPERQRRGLPSEVVDLIQRLTKRDPLLRPTAEELIEELDKIGGEALEEKDTLKRRRTRGRARSAVARRARAGRKAPALAAILIGLLLAGGAAVVLLGDKGNGPPPEESADLGVIDTPTPEDPPPDPVDEGPVLEDTPPPAETEEERKARELQERLAAREREAAEALERAEQWARENWRSLADNDAVRKKYLSVYDRYRLTKAGKEAVQRANDIVRKRIHPHPDRTWSDQDTIQAARERWQQVRPQIEAAIRKHDYRGAALKLPESLSGVTKAAAAFTEELDFWRDHVAELQEFQRELPKAVMAMPEDERTFNTPDGKRVISRATDAYFETKHQFTTKSYAWSDLMPAAIADLAQRAFADKGARPLLLLTAFAYAHVLKNTFYDAQLFMGATPGAHAFAPQMKAYSDRFEKRVRER